MFRWVKEYREREIERERDKIRDLAATGSK